MATLGARPPGWGAGELDAIVDEVVQHCRSRCPAIFLRPCLFFPVLGHSTRAKYFHWETPRRPPDAEPERKCSEVGPWWTLDGKMGRGVDPPRGSPPRGPPKGPTRSHLVPGLPGVLMQLRHPAAGRPPPAWLRTPELSSADRSMGVSRAGPSAWAWSTSDFRPIFGPSEVSREGGLCSPELKDHRVSQFAPPIARNSWKGIVC